MTVVKVLIMTVVYKKTVTHFKVKIEIKRRVLKRNVNDTLDL